MAHMIEENDKGFVFGTTWHGLDQYKQLDRPVNDIECLSVLDYPMEKRENYVMLNGVLVPHKDSYSIVRTDCEKVLVPAVGKDFDIIGNSVFFDSINASLLRPNADKIHVESVGTLCGGQVAFVNIALKDFAIRGDQSQTATKIAYYNPLGLGSYKTFVHSTRIVCMNTLKIAEAQGAANKSIHKISHTKSAAERLDAAVVDLADLFLGIEKHKTILDAMTLLTMDSVEVEAFAKQLYEFDGKEGKGKTRFENNFHNLLTTFEGQEGFDHGINRSRYAMLQAVTNVVDHGTLRKGNDAAYRSWDGLVGNSSKFKERALALLHPNNSLFAIAVA